MTEEEYRNKKKAIENFSNLILGLEGILGPRYFGKKITQLIDTTAEIREILVEKYGKDFEKET